MKNEKKKTTLLKDLCGRLPYGVKVSVSGGEFDSYRHPYLLTAISEFGSESRCKVYNPIYTPFGCPEIQKVKPYLRSMELMTDEEIEAYHSRCEYDAEGNYAGYPRWFDTVESFDYLNSIHVDYRGLIKKGFALEAPEGIYKK